MSKKVNELDAGLKPEQRHKLLVVAILIRIWIYRHRLRNWNAESRGEALIWLLDSDYTNMEYTSNALTNGCNSWSILHDNGWIQDPDQQPGSNFVARVKEGVAGKIVWLGRPRGVAGSYLKATAQEAEVELISALEEAANWQDRGLAYIKQLCPTIGEKMEGARGDFIWLGNKLSPADLKMAEELIAAIHPNGERGIPRSSFTLLIEKQEKAAA